MMNTLQINTILKKNLKTRKFFRGVFASDTLPKILSKPAIVIANTDSSNLPGTHWVAFYFNSKGNAEYFDSSGQYPHKKEFITFLRRNSKRFTFNKHQLQGQFSNTCGHYCMVYSLYKSSNKTLKQFQKKFSKRNFILNDFKILKMFTNSFKK